MKIMIIDDEEATQSLFNQQFKEEIKSGLFEFSFANSAEEGLQKLQDKTETDPVLILSDIKMGGMNGLELLKHLKADAPERPVMIVTAYGDEANHNQAMAYKADGFIHKPIDFAALREKILKFYPHANTPQKSQEPSHTTHTTHILVVDDEPAIEALFLQKFRHQIKAQEMKFTFAPNGIDALALLETHQDIDILVTDLNMPKMDGLTLLKTLQKRSRKVRSIIISAYGDRDNIEKAMSLGASDFITKPIDLHELERILNDKKSL